MTVNTRVIKLILARTDLPYVELTAGLRLQVIPSITDLPHCQKHQSAAFVASQQMLVVWEDDPKRLLERANYIQETLMKMIWGNQYAYPEENEKKDPFVGISAAEEGDIDVKEEEKPRRIVLIQALLTAATLILIIASIGGGWRNVAIELIVDTNYIRLAFVLCVLPQIWLGLVGSSVACSALRWLTILVFLSSPSCKHLTANRPYWTNE